MELAEMKARVAAWTMRNTVRTQLERLKQKHQIERLAPLFEQIMRGEETGQNTGAKEEIRRYITDYGEQTVRDAIALMRECTGSRP
jgi:hypothetical protein